MIRTQFHAAVAAVLLSLVITTTSCREKSETVVRLRPETFSASDESKIGSQLAYLDWASHGINVLQEDSGITSDSAYSYINPLMLQLVDQSHITRRDSFAWHIHIVQDEAKQVCTVPGGHIMLNTGLLNSLSNEAQLIGILAREIALSEKGYSMESLARELDDNVLLGDLILGRDFDEAELINVLHSLTYTKSEIKSADSLVALIICPSDYDERELTEAVQRLGGKSPYQLARPTPRNWVTTFNLRIEDCPGADSLYSERYQLIRDNHLPK